MKKQFTRFFSVLVLGASVASGQQQQLIPCGTYQAMEEIFASDPAARARWEAAEAENLSNMYEQFAAKGSNTEYTVPVVFHVLHQGGPENLADSKLIQALAWVNMDFDRSHSDVGNVVEPFQSMFVDSDIKFMLARKDPQGNCTNGIVHYYDSRTIWKRDGQLGYNSPLYAGITWDPTKYLNIIIVKEIVTSTQQSGIVVGYTFKPGTHGIGDTRDAVVMTASFLDDVKETRNLTHEIGHWLGLAHTFGNTNDPGQVCGDDGVCDTPPTKGKLGGCDPSLSGNTCATTTTCPAPLLGYSAGMQNTQNIMNYSDCAINFTHGQTNLMRGVLASGQSNRPNLSTPLNLANTDVNGAGVCPPKADFSSSSNSYTVCAGSSLEMKDYSFNGDVTGYLWNASGAIVSASGSSVTNILFPSVGTYSVNLTVSNNLGTSVKTKVVTAVDGSAEVVGPLNEGFELGVIPDMWEVVNPNATSGTWKHTYTAAFEGAGSMMLEGATLGPNQIDYLYTPIIDMASSPVKDLHFAYAYARKTSSSNDVFKVQASPDCGGTWIDLINLSSTQMANGSGNIQASPFTPIAGQWKTIELEDYPTSSGPWVNLQNSQHLTVRFVFEEGSTGFGNNFFLDAIALPAPTGMQELKSAHNVRVFPNPSAGEVQVQFSLSKASQVKIALTDLAGRQLEVVKDQQMEAGEQKVLINKRNSLAKGVYLLNIEVEGIRMTEKLLVR